MPYRFCRCCLGSGHFGDDPCEACKGTGRERIPERNEPYEEDEDEEANAPPAPPPRKRKKG